MHGNFLWAIWDTFHWNFLSNLVSRQLETSPRTPFGQFWHMSIFGDSRAIRVLWPKSGVFRKRFFSRWRSNGMLKWLGGVLGGQVPRLYGGTIFGGGVQHPRGVWWAFESEGSVFQNLCQIFLTPKISEFWPINWHRCVTICNLEYCILFYFLWVWCLSYGCSSNWPFWGWQTNCRFMAWRVNNFNAMSFGNL